MDHNAIDRASGLRSNIVALETAMLALPQADLPAKHHFSPGVYLRELFIPKGTLLTGKIHLTEHLSILSQGEMLVWTEDGIKQVKASTVVPSKPGAKRVGYALVDSTWITVHHNPTNTQDVPALEKALVVDTFEQFLEFTNQVQLQGGQGCLSSQQQ